jgi:hypothetical protein
LTFWALAANSCRHFAVGVDQFTCCAKGLNSARIDSVLGLVLESVSRTSGAGSLFDFAVGSHYLPNSAKRLIKATQPSVVFGVFESVDRARQTDSWCNDRVRAGQLSKSTQRLILARLFPVLLLVLVECHTTIIFMGDNTADIAFQISCFRVRCAYKLANTAKRDLGAFSITVRSARFAFEMFIEIAFGPSRADRV